MKSLRWAAIYAITLGVVLIVRIGLWMTRYQNVRRWLVRPCATDPQIDRRATVARIVHAVARAARLVPDATCLTQTIAAQALLSRKGIPSTIAMGLRTDSGDRFRAHAWLIWNDQVVLEGDRESVAEFSRILDLPTPTLSS